MQKEDIINHLVSLYGFQNYLEIGYYKGWSFDKINCKNKIAVDPAPSKTPDQENALPTSLIELGENRNQLLFKLTSDLFFDEVPDETKWDIILIDGLHEHEQVYRDITNSILHLNPKGFIILHDCNPPTEAHTLPAGVDGNWNGDVYKAIIKAKSLLPIDFFCVDTDWGVGIMTIKKLYLTWEYFDKHRQEILNLQSVEEFLKDWPCLK